MNITINKQEHKIKFSEQLTAGEYAVYMGSLTKKSGDYDCLIKYISAVTGVSIHDTYTVDMPDESIRRLTSYIGMVKSVDEFERKDSFYYKRKGRHIYATSLHWRTLGARKLLEEKELNNQYEQAIYLLAAYLSDNYDYEQTDKIYSDLLNDDASNVYGFIIFFFNKLRSGSKSVKRSWLRRKIEAFTSIVMSSRILRAKD